MNVYIQSLILGIVEGLTEFLPVSSTAHLRITEALMRIPLDDAYWKMYTIVIQAGAILALLLLYLERIVGFMKSFPKGESGERTWKNHPISLTLIAFACTSIPALALKKWSDKNLGSLTVIAIALLLGGIIMWVIDARFSRYEANTLHVEEMSLGQSIWIGLCQSLSAIFPGTSRSMSTIAAGQIVGLGVAGYQYAAQHLCTLLAAHAARDQGRALARHAPTAPPGAVAGGEAELEPAEAVQVDRNARGDYEPM